MLFIKFPKWILSANRYVIKTRMYLLVPLAGLTISNYVKDIDNIKLRSTIASNKQKHDEQLKENVFLKERLNSYYRDWNDFPYAIYEKLVSGDRAIFIGFNNTFKDSSLLPIGMSASDILGKTNDDIDIFTDSMISEFRRSDNFVIDTGIPMKGIETQIDSSGKKYDVLSIKWRKLRINKDTTLIGIVIPLDSLLKLK